MDPTATGAAEVLAGGGEMGALMRALDWASTPIGPVADWPQSLRTSVSTCLNSRFPILLWWGPELVMLYNDAYRPILGTDKHPRAIGAPGRAIWPEIWDIIGPMLEGVLTRGEATWSEDQMLPLDRKGYVEECYFTFSYSPIRDESGGIGGIFTAVTETTERVYAERGIRTLRELGTAAVEARTIPDAEALCMRALETNPHDIPFALLYRIDGSTAQLVGSTNLKPGAAAAPRTVEIAAPRAAWPLARVARGETETVAALPARFGDAAPSSAWGDPVETAVILPITGRSHPAVGAALVLGITPRRELDRVYRTGEPFVASEMPILLDRRGDGTLEEVIANFVYQPLFEPDGSVSGILGHAVDVTEQVRSREQVEELQAETEAINEELVERTREAETARAEAEEANRAKSSFLANMSHELRTPLNAIIGYTDLLEMGVAGPVTESQARHLGRITAGAKHLLQLIEEVLTFSRIEAGRLEVHWERVDLRELVRDTASMIAPLADAKGLRFHHDLPAVPATLLTDEGKVRQILINLLGNAIKFTDRGEVRLRASTDGDDVVLEVSDTGIGIAPEELEQIFEPFQQASRGTTRHADGTGLGLSVTRQLARLLGGDVTLESTPGRGSAFRVRLPARGHDGADGASE